MLDHTHKAYGYSLPKETANDSKLAPQPDEGGDSKFSTVTYYHKMPPDGDSGVTNSGPLNEMPPDGYLLAEEPGAGGAPPDAGANMFVRAIRIIESDDAVLAGALARIAAREGSIVVRGLGHRSPREVTDFVRDAMGAEPRPPPAPRGWPAPPGCMQVHLLGSPGSGGEYIAPSGDDTDYKAKLAAWLRRPEEPSLTTDWHTDEPWEPEPARFTMLYAAVSEGDCRTRVASTADFWRDGMAEADREVCRTAQGRFAPPPWLPQEDAQTWHPLMRRTCAGDAMYVCADSLVAVSDMRRDEAISWCWRLTRECCSKERCTEHRWKPFDLLVIDNYSTLHSRVKYDEQKQNRLLYRLRV